MVEADIRILFFLDKCTKALREKINLSLNLAKSIRVFQMKKHAWKEILFITFLQYYDEKQNQPFVLPLFVDKITIIRDPNDLGVLKAYIIK